MKATSTTAAKAATIHHHRSPRFGGVVARVEGVSDMGVFGCRHPGPMGRGRTARERLRKDTHSWTAGNVGSPLRWRMTGRLGGGVPDQSPDRSPKGCPPWSGLEAVAHAGLGDEVAGPGVVLLELAPDTTHEHPQVLRLRLVLGSPHLLQELALGHQPARVADQDRDQVPLLGGEVHLGTIADDPLGVEVEGEPLGLHAVSYTHLTLPPKRIV